MNSKYKYLGKNTLVFAISSFGTKFLSFLLVPLYTNILTTGEYGVADLITTTATLMIYVFTINIAEAVLRFALEQKKNTNSILAYGIKVLAIGTLLLISTMAIVYWAHFIDWKPSYYVYLILYFFFTALYQILTNYLRAVDKVTAVAMAGIVSSISMISANLLFLLIVKIGLNGYLIALISGPAAGTFYSIYKIGLPLRDYFDQSASADTKKAMISYSIPLIFNNIALWINAFLDRYFVTAFCGVAQNGVYAIASKIPTILSMCYTVFAQAWTLSAIREFDKEDKDGFFSETYSMYNSLMVVACSVLILINIPLAKFLYSGDFFIAWEYSSVLLISVLFNSVTAFFGSIFSAVKDSKAIAVTTLISAAVNILLNLILIPIMGPLGAAIATAACYAVMAMVRYIVIRKYILIRINLYKDSFIYGLLIIQVFLEHTTNHGYIGQIIILGSIVFLYRNNASKALEFIHKAIIKRFKK
jgi:O-antigen/teichoic acid export membrane protein